MTVQYLVGDTREVVRTLADGSVSLIATSPPFYQLRSYLQGDHTDKALEIGSEPDPATFLDTLLTLTAEWGRVLAPWGSLAIELGDTYSGSGGAGGDYNDGGLHEGQGKFEGSARASRRSANGAVKANPKCLALIPELYRVALAYGFNPLTGAPSPAGKWLIRNVICWHRPNPAVGALGDKVRPSTSYIVVATRSPRRWFDLTAVRTEHSERSLKNAGYPNVYRTSENDEQAWPVAPNPAGAPPLDTWTDPYDVTHDTWTLTTQPSPLAHYAMWPAKLAERLILMMCPAQVCRICGEPRRRVERLTPQVERQQALGALIRQQREAKGLTVKEVAHYFPSQTGGLTGCVSNWELAANVPTVGQWPVLKELLDLGDEFDDMIEGERVWTFDPAEYLTADGQIHDGLDRDKSKSIANGYGGHTGKRDGSTTRQPKTLGWTDCGCDVFDDLVDGGVSKYRPGLVLDPFAGSGTTLAVADLHGRDAIGIDLDPRNHDLYPARYNEVKKALYGTPAPQPGQGVLAL